MCSCSGNCNCNSSTIPRGPQGTPGTAATIAVGNVTSGSPAAVTNSGTSNAAIFNFTIPPGAPGSNGAPGTPGINGKNAYTTTADVYTQPNIGGTAFIEVGNTSWMSVNQIIFVGNPTGTSNIGGYYKVTAITSAFNFEAERLDWSIPGVTYVSQGDEVLSGAIIQASGTIGATGPAGANGNGITIIKSVTNTIPAGLSSLQSIAGTSFNLTNPSDIFLANDLCPNDGDVGRITYEVVVRRTNFTSSANISMDVYLGMSGYPIPSPLIPELDPYLDTGTNQDNNKLNGIIWSTNPAATEYMYIKYVIDVQRITSTTAHIFVEWRTKSATTSNSGCYHNNTTINDLDFDNLSKYFEFAVKGFNNSSTATLTFNKSRFYVESLRLPQP